MANRTGGAERAAVRPGFFLPVVASVSSPASPTPNR